MSKSYFLKALGFILITILFISACYSENSIENNQEVSDEWKTFTNQQYGYSFEVPAFCYEGRLPGECKQSPPEERSEECLCHIDGTNPNSVMFQKFTITSEEVTLATLSIMSPDTPKFSPAEGTDLVSFIQQEFGERYSEEIPGETNLELGGFPALRISISGSPGVAAYQEIFFIKENKLFKINMIDIEAESNMNIYEQILASFAFSE